MRRDFIFDVPHELVVDSGYAREVPETSDVNRLRILRQRIAGCREVIAASAKKERGADC